MAKAIGDSDYRLRLQAREAGFKLRIAQRIGALLPVTIRGVTVNLYGTVGKEEKRFDKATQTEQAIRVFSFPRQLYTPSPVAYDQHNRPWQIWVPGPVFNFEAGMTIVYEGFDWACQEVDNKDTKRIEFQCTALRSHMRRV